jgi:DNA-binding GntR family transcriptional regulator
VTKGEAAYGYLRDAITSGLLKPGEHIVLRKVATELGISEVPVRDAIKMLEGDGLVVIRPHAGAVVSDLARDDIVQLFDARVGIEAYAARLAAASRTDEDLEALRELIEGMDRCIGSQDYADYGRLNREFNRRLAHASANRTLIEIIDRLEAQTDRAPALFVWDPPRALISNEEHRQILDSMVRGDADAVEREVRAHRTAGFAAFLAALDRITTSEAPVDGDPTARALV